MPKHDYWKLEKVEWENGAGIEQLSIFGIGPILVILGVIDDITEEYEKGDHDKVRYLNFAVGNMLNNMDRCIYRLLKEQNGQPEAAEETASPKIIQDTLSEGDNCLKCAKWNNGKGLEVLYQSGIYPAILHTESIMKDTSDLMTIRQLDIIVDCLQGVGDAITNFQVELGIIDEMTEAAGEAKPQSTFEDPRFSEYVAQINIDGHNPVDILEAWLKEHNPEFLKDD